MKNLCLDCPDTIRGLCCHPSMIIEGYNIVLKDVYCPYLDKITNECVVYHRRDKIKWCESVPVMRKTGAMPVGCHYLNGWDGIPPKQKINMIKWQSAAQQKRVLIEYRRGNSMKFEELMNWAIGVGKV